MVDNPAELREEDEKQQHSDEGGSEPEYGSDEDAGSGEERTSRRRRPKKPAVVNSAVMAEAIEHGARRTAGIGARMTRGAARKCVVCPPLCPGCWCFAGDVLGGLQDVDCCGEEGSSGCKGHEIVRGTHRVDFQDERPTVAGGGARTESVSVLQPYERVTCPFIGLSEIEKGGQLHASFWLLLLV